MRKINKYINRFLNMIKWPVGILMLILLVPAFQVDFYLMSKGTDKEILLEFFLPFAVTVLFFLIMPSLSGSFFTIAEHDFLHALVCCLIIAIVTFGICIGGLYLGKKFGTKLAGKASILGGAILILIGLEIFITSWF